MEGSVSNVQFSERKRGYDPDEVANYLAHIDDKIAGLRSIAAEAIERAEHAEERARVAEHHAAQQAGSAGDGPAQAAGVLAMAQQTADATVAQARQDAEGLLARAREEADRHRLAAEAEAQQLLADARRDLESRRTEHLDAMRHEIDDLVAMRDAVGADVAALEEHLALQRARVVRARDALALVADDPEALRAAAVPEVASTTVGWSTVTGEAGAGDGADLEVEAFVADAAPAADTGFDPSDVVMAEAGAELEEVRTFPPDPDTGYAETGYAETGYAETGYAGDELASRAFVGDQDPPGAGSDPGDLPWGGGDPDATAPVSAVGGLFDDDAVDEPEPAHAAEEAGGLFGDDAPDQSAFGSFDEEDDEAMRAFFEGEVDEEGRGGRWGFRRR